MSFGLAHRLDVVHGVPAQWVDGAAGLQTLVGVSDLIEFSTSQNKKVGDFVDQAQGS